MVPAIGGSGIAVSAVGPYDGNVGDDRSLESEQLIPRRAAIGPTTSVDRYLPTRHRTTVGAWCFLDAYGPDDVEAGPGMQVGPHPHTGLQTVTWLLAGEAVHRDSLGSVVTIRPGELNLMTAGHGIAHAESSPAVHPRLLQGVQLWLALPGTSRDVPPAFEHLDNLPVVDLEGARATVLVGTFAGVRSPATVFSPLVGLEVAVDPPNPVGLPLDPDFEHAVLVLTGSVMLDGRLMATGSATYLGRGRSQVVLTATAAVRVLVLGGEPYGEPLAMWWNFVGGSHEEIVGAREDWAAGRRFGPVRGFDGEPIPAPDLPPGRIRLRG